MSATIDETTADLQRQIGALAMNFAPFETALACAVGFLTNPDWVRQGQILTAELSFKARLAAFAVLYAEREPSANDGLQDFLKAAHHVEDQRNMFLHSFYWPGPVGDSRATRIKVTAKERKGFKIRFETVTPEMIAAQAKAAWDMAGCLDKLMLPIDGYADYAARFYAMKMEG
jgi:hypothetical protein